ncbi:Uncharacterised protein [Mycoplasmopsis maculosa]|uniref:Uncharacterized protein n=1 Tax=Mycoplasmopsis maculosa TaxID=114885 RepID=A0A449B5B3_9BACT|nr:hypothetical protein [Mycoplasmopsis maculosa]VEU75759.1 Uncharacterised protein [Mycoplasmopsis maculosa]
MKKININNLINNTLKVELKNGAVLTGYLVKDKHHTSSWVILPLNTFDNINSFNKSEIKTITYLSNKYIFKINEIDFKN